MTTFLEIDGEPAFKGSSFTADEYKEAWGDDWHTVFMQILHEEEEEAFELCTSCIAHAN